MAYYSNLKTAIENAVDWNNGDNEITGQNLLDILETIIDSLGAKYKFADVATPSSNITTPDEPLFYLAGAGTYTNFSGLSVTIPRGTLAIFYYDTAWQWTSVRTDSDAFFNVNQYLGTPSTTYTKANARNAVPSDLRSKGIIITYLTTAGWLIEQNLDATAGTWADDASWQTIGPVSVSQNTLSIGNEEVGELAGQLVDNPEWVELVLNSEGQILYGVKSNGDFVFGKGELKFGGGKYFDISNPQFIELVTDRNGGIIYGVDKKGNLLFKNEKLDKELNDLKEFNQSVAIKLKGNFNPNSYYDTSRTFTPMVRPLDVKPLVYMADSYFEKPLSYPDGTVIYAANSGNVIKKITPSGEEITLLTVEGAVGAFQMLWMDSNYNVFAAPRINNSVYYLNTGLYKLSYGENSFTQVLSLEDIYSDDAELRENEAYTIWTMTEDRDGNLYAGAYGNPFCPFIYKSVDGGDTWFLFKDMSVYAPNGKHIHFIQYNKYDNCLYCTVGEVNRLLKSSDGGNTWQNMNVTLEKEKSCSICCVEDGIILGSDYGYWGMMYKVYADGSYKTTTKFWANAIFSIRQSDITGWVYALGVIDNAASNLNYYPPVGAIDDPAVLQSWIESNPPFLSEWQAYYNDMINVWPDDAIRPQHSAILISKDRGETWEILCRLEGSTHGALGYFKNGENSFTMEGITNKTYVISEGKQRYVATGIDCTGDILIKLNSENIVEQI